LCSQGFFVAAQGAVVTFTAMLQTCQAGFETLLVRELADAGVAVTEHGPGWVVAPEVEHVADLAFPHVTLRTAREFKGESVNALATQIADFFLTSLQGERIESAWPCVFGGPAEHVGLGRRMSAVEKALFEILRKRFARVAKLAVADLPRGAGPARGLFIWFTDFGRLFVARDAWIHGQRRMADDELAPSRSYLKVEEAFVVLGREPAPDETVVDLGAAPGGWSYSAAKRGARVIAVDNGPLKGGALGNSLIEHRAEDAFHFNFEAGVAYDWMLCDLLEEPHHVMKNLIEPWLARGWCRRFVFNLKFGHVDSVALLRELRAPDGPLARYAPGAQIRHLYHDREEFTVVGEVINSHPGPA
jgi:23S rRNA (cytidine2498-2'-O)-methyltransferase